MSARPSGLQTAESLQLAKELRDGVDTKPVLTEQPEHISSMETVNCSSSLEASPSDVSPDLKASRSDNDSLAVKDFMDMDTIDIESTSDFGGDASGSAVESPPVLASQGVKDLENIDMVQNNLCSSALKETSGCMAELYDTVHTGNSDPSPGLPNGFSCLDMNSCAMSEHQNGGDVGGLENVKIESGYGNGSSGASENGIAVEEARTRFSGISSLPSETSSANQMHQLKRGSPLFSS